MLQLRTLFFPRRLSGLISAYCLCLSCYWFFINNKKEVDSATLVFEIEKVRDAELHNMLKYTDLYIE